MEDGTVGAWPSSLPWGRPCWGLCAVFWGSPCERPPTPEEAVPVGGGGKPGPGRQ